LSKSARSVGIHLAWGIAACLVAAALPLASLGQRACGGSSATCSVTGKVSSQRGELTSRYALDVIFDTSYRTASGETVAQILNDSINHGWNCLDKKDFVVKVNSTQVPIEEIDNQRVATDVPQPANCLNRFVRPGDAASAIPDSPKELELTIYDPHLNGAVNWLLLEGLSGPLKVEILGLTDASNKPVSLSGTGKIDWKTSILRASAQTVSNETLTDKTTYKKSIYQFPIAANLPIARLGGTWGGVFAETKNTFSTNERDSKSAFVGGVGIQVGLMRRWTIPCKVEEEATGNQVATNLAAVTNAQVSTTLPWTTWLTPGATTPYATSTKAWHDLPAWNNAPTLTISFPYTHRVNQVVAPGSKALPVDDWAINPAMALTNERLLDFWHPKDPTSRGDPNKPAYNPWVRVAPFTFKWEADWGMYFLPLEQTAKGTDRAEGTGDVSILIPISNFAQIPGLTLDQTSQINQMQLRIKWQDSVNATNNYVRTRGWTFGLEMTVKK
jgi:hypothetical protein